HVAGAEVEAGDAGDGLRGEEAPRVLLLGHGGGTSGMWCAYRFVSPTRQRGAAPVPRWRVGLTTQDAKILRKRSPPVSSPSRLGVSLINFSTTMSVVTPSEAAVKLVRMRCRSTG